MVKSMVKSYLEESKRFILKIHNTYTNLTTIDLYFYFRTFDTSFWVIFLNNASLFTYDACSFPSCFPLKIDREKYRLFRES